MPTRVFPFSRGRLAEFALIYQRVVVAAVQAKRDIAPKAKRPYPGLRILGRHDSIPVNGYDKDRHEQAVGGIFWPVRAQVFVVTSMDSDVTKLALPPQPGADRFRVGLGGLNRALLPATSHHRRVPFEVAVGATPRRWSTPLGATAIITPAIVWFAQTDHWRGEAGETPAHHIDPTRVNPRRPPQQFNGCEHVIDQLVVNRELLEVARSANACACVRRSTRKLATP